MQALAIPTKCTPRSGCTHVILERNPGNHSLGQKRAEMVLNLFLQTLSVTVPCFRPVFVPLRAAGAFCRSVSAVGGSAPGLTFPGEGADPEAQAPCPGSACLHPTGALCLPHSECKSGFGSLLKWQYYIYSSYSQRNKHQALQSRSFTSAQLVKNRSTAWLDEEGITGNSLDSLLHFAKDLSEPRVLSHMYSSLRVFCTWAETPHYLPTTGTIPVTHTGCSRRLLTRLRCYSFRTQTAKSTQRYLKQQIATLNNTQLL